MCGTFAAMTPHGLSSDRSDACVLKLLEHRGADGTARCIAGDDRFVGTPADQQRHVLAVALDLERFETLSRWHGDD